MCATAKTWLEMYEEKFTGECAKLTLEPMRVKFKTGEIRLTSRRNLYFYTADSLKHFLDWLACKDAPYRIGEVYGGRRVTNRIKCTIDIVRMHEGAEIEGVAYKRCSDIVIAPAV